MSLDKAIEHHKERRREYRGSKAIDATCRNHGSCKWCENNRRFKFRDKHPAETKTNADRIRSMSDEDLADFIYDKTEDGSYKAWLEWLKREASDGLHK